MVTALKDQDLHIDAAVHGQSSPNSGKDNEEPATFFFAIFGLAFEVLTSGVNGSGTLELTNIVVALQAVECLVQRKYCGKVFVDARILDELIRAFYRLALTAKEEILESLLHAVVSLADSLQSISRYGLCVCSLQPFLTQENSSVGLDHCLKIAVHVMKRSCERSQVQGRLSGYVNNEAMAKCFSSYIHSFTSESGC